MAAERKKAQVGVFLKYESQYSAFSPIYTRINTYLKKG
jgi:hypothetical protein